MNSVFGAGMRFLVLLTLFVPASLLADPVLSFDTADALSGDNNNQTVGWEFDVLTPISVTGLGWYDQGGDGLQLAHEVGIWNSAGDLLGSVLVAQGTADPLDGLFRTASITPILLMPGTDYVIGGENFSANTEQLAFNVEPTTVSSISFVAGEYSNVDNTFERPTNATGDPECCWGPSFSATGAVASIPEPRTTSTLLSTCFLVMLITRRSRARRTR